MSLVEYAQQELDREGMFDEDSDYGGMLGRSTLDLIKVFSEQGHSGMSAQAVIWLFNKLAKFQPLSPLTDDPNEWQHIHGNVWQSTRSSGAFSSNGGKTYYMVDEPKKKYRSDKHAVSTD